MIIFFTSDGADDHGLVNLTLHDSVTYPVLSAELLGDTTYRGIASAHNLVIDEDRGFAYPVGASQGGETCGGGLHIVDIRKPKESALQVVIRIR